MKTLILFTICLVLFSLISTTSSNFQEWNEYKQKYHKNYLGIDDTLHFLTYISNKNLISAHNLRFERKLVKYKLGLGQFTDINLFEFYQMLGGIPPRQINPSTITNKTYQSSLIPPNYRNWTSDGGVTEVKDQGMSCNAAWAFAAVASIEGHYFVNYMELPPTLSAQNLIDCTVGQQSCSGVKTPRTAYDYVKYNENINSEAAYPYTGYQGFCNYNKNDYGTIIGNYESIRENDDNSLFQVVAFQGPVVVGFNPFSFEFQHYKSGIFEPPRTIYNNTNRYFMTVVGYGHDDIINSNYWIVKNSMGINWGERGYMRVIRNLANPISKSAVFPNV